MTDNDDTAENSVRATTTGARDDWLEHLHALNLPRRGTIPIRELCERAGALRGRSITLVPMTLPSQVTGLWLSTTTGTDYIAFEQTLAPVHKFGTILHEVGHVLCDHRETPVIDLDATRSLWPSLSPSLINGVLGRDHSDSATERQAEYLGSTLAFRARMSAELTRSITGDRHLRDLASRLSSLFDTRS